MKTSKDIERENMMKIISMIKVEDEMNKAYQKFGGDDGFITVSDVTREIRKNPKLLQEIRDFIKEHLS